MSKTRALAPPHAGNPKGPGGDSTSCQQHRVQLKKPARRRSGGWETSHSPREKSSSASGLNQYQKGEGPAPKKPLSGDNKKKAPTKSHKTVGRRKKQRKRHDCVNKKRGAAAGCGQGEAKLRDEGLGPGRDACEHYAARSRKKARTSCGRGKVKGAGGREVLLQTSSQGKSQKTIYNFLAKRHTSFQKK